ncbi:hypothetical protein BJP34_06370 [Moorena producens PAL-8-15-08-1]|uniref:DZANK-type domain-containing protein n=1 Tax=Moorena producens PAL-8-15-08-1 TaxID=1458985 RepID=A0A1D8TNZ9_9CYAN|nr:hypothetical protein [Moorena producens]AOW99125.1 hypothetical protein BJP34_06370 [Moorena producens PAL-8-15-08-1]
MMARISRLLSQFFSKFFSKSRTLSNEPLNKVSLIVIVVIDIFILINVFVGLNDISRWPMSPAQTYPCYYEWNNYRRQTDQDKDYNIISRSLGATSFKKSYQQAEEGHLGQVFTTCLKYADYKDKIKNPQNQQTERTINQKQSKISSLRRSNNTIREQYDSTLLEKIAGQSRERSINQVSAEQTKQELERNNRNISRLQQEIDNIKNEMLSRPESVSLLDFIKDDKKFHTIRKKYQQASFWYPSIQFAFQSLFLLPLIFIALSVHKFTQRRGYGLIALISWHLLVIFFIPLIVRLFEFLKVGAIFQFIFDIISEIFGRLLFLVSYVYILLIPLIGFGIIKFFQKIIFNTKLQAASRVKKLLCINCARKIKPDDHYCPHCGYYQYVECQSCHNITYKYLSYCKHCGSYQDSVVD